MAYQLYDRTNKNQIGKGMTKSCDQCIHYRDNYCYQNKKAPFAINYNLPCNGHDFVLRYKMAKENKVTNCSKCYYRYENYCYVDKYKPEYKLDSIYGKCDEFKLRDPGVYVSSTTEFMKKSKEPIDRELLRKTKELLDEIE